MASIFSFASALMASASGFRLGLLKVRYSSQMLEHTSRSVPLKAPASASYQAPNRWSKASSPPICSPASTRLATSMSIQRSHLASPGASTAFSNTAVRRSPLPKAPSRSTHMAAGSTTSAYWQDSVGYTSDTQMKASLMPVRSPRPRRRVRLGIDTAQLLWALQRKSMPPLESSRNIFTVW